jgi:YHS domain-containing protein
MTLARPIRSVCLAICLSAPAPALASGLSIGTSELVSADALSGLAIDGFDPVAYFVDQRPLAGKAEFETTWRGATWRFANAANRDAFLADPDVFAPAFGGYDAEAVTRGVTAGSNPPFSRSSRTGSIVSIRKFARAVPASRHPPVRRHGLGPDRAWASALTRQAGPQASRQSADVPFAPRPASVYARRERE